MRSGSARQRRDWQKCVSILIGDPAGANSIPSGICWPRRHEPRRSPLRCAIDRTELAYIQFTVRCERKASAETGTASLYLMSLSLKPPLPPMEARSVDEIPRGNGWHDEPKWDGFRCLAFRDGNEIFLQSKAGQPLARYFPDIVRALGLLKAKRFVLDGELAILIGGELSFDELQLRLHPAASRVKSSRGASGHLCRLRSARARERKIASRPTPAGASRATGRIRRGNSCLTKPESDFRPRRQLKQAQKWFKQSRRRSRLGLSPNGSTAPMLRASGLRW